MGERGSSFEAFETRHSPERYESTHSPELAPDVTCDATVEIEIFTSKSDESTHPEKVSGTLSCESCPVKGHVSGRGVTQKEAIAMAFGEAREIVRPNCEKWVMERQFYGLSTDTPMPDSFMSPQLRS